MSDLLVVETKAAKWNRLREKLLAEFSEHDAQGQALEKELNERLEDGGRLLVRFVESIPEGHFHVGVKENRWHIIRKGLHENDIDHYLPIVGPEFQYRAPELKVVEDMQKCDLGKKGALDKLFKDRERQARLKEVDEQLRKEQKVDEFAQTYSAMKRVKGDEKLLKDVAKDSAKKDAGK